MPTREINLVSQKKEENEHEKYFKNLINRYLPIILGVFIVITGVTLGYNIILDSQIISADQNIAAEKDKISQMNKNEGMYLMLKQKAVAINMIRKGVYPYAKFFEFSKNLEQYGGILTNFVINEAGEMTLTMQVKDAVKLEDLTNAVVTKAKEAFKSVELSSITYKADRSFDIKLTVDIDSI